MVDEIELQVILVDPVWLQAKDSHALEHEAHATREADIATEFVENAAHARNRAGRIIGGGFHHHRYAMWGIPLVDQHLVVGRVFAHRALDGGLDLVFGHVDCARVLDHPPQHRIVSGIGSAAADRDGDVLTDPCELLRHPIPAGEHRVLAYFEHASHGVGALNSRKDG